MTPLVNKTIYIVLADFWVCPTEANGGDNRYMGWEGIVNERSLTRSDVVRDLANGEWDHPVQIIEIDLAKGTCRDISRDIAEDAAALLHSEGRDIHDMPDWIHRIRYRGPKMYLMEGAM